MTASEISKKYLFHRKVVIWSILTIYFLLFQFEPWQMTAEESLVFWAISLGGFMFHTDGNFIFSGYGVAKEINRIAATQIYYDCGNLVWARLAPPALARSWYMTIGICIVWGVAAFAIGRFASADVAANYQRLISISILAWLLARFGEFYLWLMIDHYRYFYIYEADLRDRLKVLRFPGTQIDEIVRQAHEEELLFRA